MPLIKNTPEVFSIYKDDVVVETRVHNAIKIVATTPDNELNITPLFIEEGFYDTETKKFTSYKVHDEILLDAATFQVLNVKATTLVCSAFVANGNAIDPSLTNYSAEKVVAYDFVAEKLGIPSDSYTVV